MSRWPISPRGRFWLMQASLWAALAMSLGLAGLLQWRYRRVQDAPLGAWLKISDLRFRQPQGWLVRRGQELAVMEEPARGAGLGRKLEVRCQRGGVFMTPLECLVRSGDLLPADAADLLAGNGSAPGESRLKGITIAGWPGVLFSQLRLVRGDRGQLAVPWKQTVACAILPGGRTVVLRLDGQGVGEAADEELIRRVGQSISAQGQQLLPPGRKMELAQETGVVVPAEFAAPAKEERLRIGRLLARGRKEWWFGAEVVPCLVEPGREAQALPSMMLWRDPAWRPGQVMQVDKTTWVCPRRQGELFPVITYLRSAGDGRAVLVEFRWNGPALGAAADGPAITRIWRELAGGIDFSAWTTWGKLLSAGKSAVNGLGNDAAKLLDGSAMNQRWQWYHLALSHTAKMNINYKLIDGGAIKGSYTIEHSPATGWAGGEAGQWQLSADMTKYALDLSRIGPVPALSQQSRVVGENLIGILLDGPAAVMQGRDQAISPYLPGALLPLAIGRLPYQAMLVRSESVLSTTPGASPTALTIRLEPAFDLPEPAEPNGPALRCWAVQVSGSTQSSRWYVDGDGRLVSISFAGGIRLQRLEATGEQ